MKCTDGRIYKDGEEEKIPEPPESDIPQGVLPRIIATLVNRRRQVKSLMKDRTLLPAKLLQVFAQPSSQPYRV